MMIASTEELSSGLDSPPYLDDNIEELVKQSRLKSIERELQSIGSILDTRTLMKIEDPPITWRREQSEDDLRYRNIRRGGVAEPAATSSSSGVATAAALSAVSAVMNGSNRQGVEHGRNDFNDEEMIWKSKSSDSKYIIRRRFEHPELQAFYEHMSVVEKKRFKLMCFEAVVNLAKKLREEVGLVQSHMDDSGVFHPLANAHRAHCMYLLKLYKGISAQTIEDPVLRELRNQKLSIEAAVQSPSKLHGGNVDANILTGTTGSKQQQQQQQAALVTTSRKASAGKLQSTQAFNNHTTAADGTDKAQLERQETRRTSNLSAPKRKTDKFSSLDVDRRLSNSKTTAVQGAYAARGSKFSGSAVELPKIPSAISKEKKNPGSNSSSNKKVIMVRQDSTQKVNKSYDSHEHPRNQYDGFDSARPVRRRSLENIGAGDVLQPSQAAEAAQAATVDPQQEMFSWIAARLGDAPTAVGSDNNDDDDDDEDQSQAPSDHPNSERRSSIQFQLSRQQSLGKIAPFDDFQAALKEYHRTHASAQDLFFLPSPSRKSSKDLFSSNGVVSSANRSRHSSRSRGYTPDDELVRSKVPRKTQSIEPQIIGKKRNVMPSSGDRSAISSPTVGENGEDYDNDDEDNDEGGDEGSRPGADTDEDAYRAYCNSMMETLRGNVDFSATLQALDPKYELYVSSLTADKPVIAKSLFHSTHGAAHKTVHRSSSTIVSHLGKEAVTTYATREMSMKRKSQSTASTEFVNYFLSNCRDDANSSVSVAAATIDEKTAASIAYHRDSSQPDQQSQSLLRTNASTDGNLSDKFKSAAITSPNSNSSLGPHGSLSGSDDGKSSLVSYRPSTSQRAANTDIQDTLQEIWLLLDVPFQSRLTFMRKYSTMAYAGELHKAVDIWAEAAVLVAAKQSIIKLWGKYERGYCVPPFSYDSVWSDIERKVPIALLTRPGESVSVHGTPSSTDCASHAAKVAYRKVEQHIRSTGLSLEDVENLEAFGNGIQAINEHIDELLTAILKRAEEELQDAIPVGFLTCKDWMAKIKIGL